MSKQAKPYDARKLFLQGLMAFGNYFAGVKWIKSHLTKKQMRGRRAFRAAGIARREQRRLAA